MESTGPAKGLSFWQKPIEILLFGGFSIVFGLLLAFAALALAPQASAFENGNLWPLVALAGVGMVVSGIGFMAGKSWGYVFSVIIYLLAYITSIVQAFERLFVWGIFLDPIVLTFLIIPRIRSYFFKPQPQPIVTLSHEASGIVTVIGENAQTSPVSPPKKTKILQALRKPSSILTMILIFGLFAVLPAVAASVHTVSVTDVALNILYPPGSSDSNIASIWFGYSPRTVSGSMFTWGGGRMTLAFSLSNLGLFQQHTIDWFSVSTPGFTLDPTIGVPITVPDLATVNFHMVLQAPDYDFSGQVVLEMHTT